MSLTLAHVLLIAVAGVVGGAMNAAAGGGSLLTFPALLAVGLPSLTANVTNTVALSLGYLGGVQGYRRELREMRARQRRLAVDALLGAVIGTVLLELSSEGSFTAIVPWLLIASCGLLAAQPALTARLRAREQAPGRLEASRLLDVGVVLGASYGAYFGAGLGVVVLAVLGLAIPLDFGRLNALKAWVTFVVNAAAALLFCVIAPVDARGALILAPASLLGGRLGVVVARRVSPALLRGTVVVVGMAVAGRLLLE